MPREAFGLHAGEIEPQAHLRAAAEGNEGELVVRSRCWLDFITYVYRHVCGEAESDWRRPAISSHRCLIIRTAETSPLIEYDVGDNALRDGIFKEPIIVENEACVLPNRPGLGVELDPDAIRPACGITECPGPTAR
jgi:hypothetical protein